MSEFWNNFNQAIKLRISATGAAIGLFCGLLFNAIEPRPTLESVRFGTREVSEKILAKRIELWEASHSLAGWIGVSFVGLALGFLAGLLVAYVVEWARMGWHAEEGDEVWEENITGQGVGIAAYPRALVISLASIARSLLGLRHAFRRDGMAALGDSALGSPSDANFESHLDLPPLTTRDRIMTGVMYAFVLVAWIGFLWLSMLGMSFRATLYSPTFAVGQLVAAVVIGVVTWLIWMIRKKPMKPGGFGKAPSRYDDGFFNGTLDNGRLWPRAVIPDGIRAARPSSLTAPSKVQAPIGHHELWRNVKFALRKAERKSSDPSTEPLRRDLALKSLRVMLMLASIDGAPSAASAGEAIDVALKLCDGVVTPTEAVTEAKNWVNKLQPWPETRAQEEELTRAAMGHSQPDLLALLNGCARAVAADSGISERERGALTRVFGWLGADEAAVKSALWSVRVMARDSGGSRNGVVRTARDVRRKPTNPDDIAPELRQMTRRQAWLVAGMPQELATEVTTRRVPDGLAARMLHPKLAEWQAAFDSLGEPYEDERPDPVRDATVKRLGEILAAIRVLGVNAPVTQGAIG